MFRLGFVIAIPVLLGLVGGPLLLLFQANGALPGAGVSRTAVGGLATAALLGGALGLLAIVPNALGAQIVNKIGLRSWAINTGLFAGIAIATFGFLSDWIDTMLRVVGGVDLFGERTLLWLFFLLNLFLCCAVHRHRFLPKKVRTVS